MITRDLWKAKGPTLAELKILERLGRRRRALEAVTAADGDEAIVIARALATLDDMEECLCEEGPRAALLADGWQRLDELEARLARTPRPSAPPADLPEARPPADLVRHRRRPPAKPRTHGGPSLITAIDTIRSIARRAAEDPRPGNPRLRLAFPTRPRRAASSTAASSTAAPPVLPVPFLPYLGRLVTRLFVTAVPAGDTFQIVAQALAAFLPLLDLAPAPTDPDIPPEMTTRERARIDLLHQERAARAYTCQAGPDDAWLDLLGLTSEALETFIRHRRLAGVRACLVLLDLLADTFAAGRPEAAAGSS